MCRYFAFCILHFAFCIFLLSCGTPYGIYHSVEKGQTLYGIAKAYNVPTQEIIRINRFKEHVTLKEGDAVFIPGASREKMIDVTIEYKESVSPSASTVSKPQTASIPPRSEETSKTGKGRFLWPVNGKVISGFGMRNGEKHAGIDIKAEEGNPVKASDSGKVIYSGNGLSGYGNLIIIKHEGTFFTVYAHNKKNLASEGSLVEKGEDKNPACLGCHTTGNGTGGYGAEGMAEVDLASVGCEACHGAGSEYKTKKVMEDVEAAKAAGLIMPTEESCKTCHNEKSPNFKGFNYAEYWAKIAHKVPEAAAETPTKP